MPRNRKRGRHCGHEDELAGGLFLWSPIAAGVLGNAKPVQPPLAAFPIIALNAFRK